MMSYINRITARGALSFMAVVGCLLYAMFAIATATDTDCENAWDDAPAEAYCDSEGEMAIANTDKCIIGASSCSITIDITQGEASWSQSFSPTFPNAWTLNTGGVNLTDTDDIDICFAPSGGRIDVTVRTGCEDGEIDSEDATTDGIELETS